MSLYHHLIAPLLPIATEELPHVGAGLRLLEAPTAYLQELRERHGDTFRRGISRITCARSS